MPAVELARLRLVAWTEDDVVETLVVVHLEADPVEHPLIIILFSQVICIYIRNIKVIMSWRTKGIRMNRILPTTPNCGGKFPFVTGGSKILLLMASVVLTGNTITPEV